MLISKQQYGHVSLRVGKVRNQVEKELTELGHTVDKEGRVDGYSVLIFDESFRQVYKDGHWTDPDNVLVYVGRQLADHYGRTQAAKLGIKIVHLREAKKGFETDRIVKAVTKHLNQYGWRYKEWLEKATHMESVKKACSEINDKLTKQGFTGENRIAYSITRYTDGTAHYNIRLPIGADASQLHAIADNISHEMIYNEKTTPKQKEPA